MRCQKVFSGSTLGTGCESETLTLRPNEVQEVKAPQRNRSFPFKTAPYKLPVCGGRLRRPCVLITARKKRENLLLTFQFFISLLM